MVEYKVVQIKNFPMNETSINNWANDGWRLVQVVSTPGLTTSFYHHYLERNKEEVLNKSSWPAQRAEQ